MKQILFLFVVTCVFVTNAFAQRTVSGNLTDANGEALIGANVVAKGTTVGTVSDFDGNYELVVPEGTKTLVYSYTGFETREIDLGASNVVDLILAEGITLETAVVTALGVERNSRDVTYANQTVTAADLLTSPNKNTLEALRGKTAGVKITTGSGSVGASSKVVLRGEASLTGNNNALIVIDGIPIDNNSTGGGLAEGEGGYADYGNRFNDINPDDIESVTVLKGPSATSLYGSRGASGVLLITTKSGKSGKSSITFNTTTSFERAYVLLERQDQYGQGLINPDGSNNFDTGENFSWGPKFDGVIRPWTSPIDVDGDGTLEYLSRPYSNVENQLQNFFRTGRTNVNNVAFSGGGENYTLYASYGNTYQRGVLENTDYQRHNFTFRGTGKLSEKIKTSFGVSYAKIDQNTAQEGSRAFEGQNPYANAIQAPNTIPYNELRDYNNPFHSFDGYYGSYTVNPYFVLNESINNANINNFLANFSVTYSPFRNFDVTTKIGTNVVGVNVFEATPQYAYGDHFAWQDDLTLSSRDGRQQNAGAVKKTNTTNINIDWTTTAGYSRYIDKNDKLKLGLTAGVNYFDQDRRRLIAETVGGISVPGVYSLRNSVSQARSDQNDLDYRIIGFLGNASLSYDNKLFLEYSARNDYSSTLPVDNQSFFYQAVGVSAVVSEYMNLADNSVVNYLKVRGSFGTTGKDAGLYLLESTFNSNPLAIDYNDIYDINFPLNGQPGFSKGASIGNPNLKPELTTTFEAGFDLSLFNDKISVEYTFYNSNHNDQIVEVGLPRSTGFNVTALNVGKINNQGHELTLNLRPITNGNGLSWETNVAFSTNKNEVKKISDQTNELVYWDSGRGVTLVAEEGQAFGTFKGQAPLFDPNGNPIVDASGSRVYSEDARTLGNVQPDWIGSLNNTISYKRLSFNFLLDTRQGGDIFSLTKGATEFNGTSLTTLIGDRLPFVIPNSVVDNGDGTYTENTNTTLADAYTFDGNYSGGVLDGSFVKLREVGLSYDLPKSLTMKAGIKGVRVGLFAKNLKFWLPEENTFADPEVNGPATSQMNVSGIETSQTPPSRSFGFNINVQL